MRKSTVLKVVGGVVGLFVVLVLIAAAYLAANLDRHKGVVVAMIKDATGRDLVLGEVHLVPALKPTVAVDDVSFANAPWGSQPHMATGERVEVKVALIPLLSRNVVVEKFVLVEPDIFIETDAQGRGNWKLAAGGGEQVEKRPDEAGKPGAIGFGVQQIEIRKGRLRYRDGATGQTTTLVVDEFSAHADDTYSPLALELTADYNGTRIDARATVGALRTFLGNESFPVDLTIDVAEAQVKLNGALARPMDVQGLGFDLALKSESLAKLSGLAGTELPRLGPLDVSVRLSDSDGGYQLDGLEAAVGKSDVSGTLAVLLPGERPRVSAELTSSNVDLTQFTTATSRGKAPADSGGEVEKAPRGQQTAKKAARVFSPDPLPLDALRAVDADVSLRAERIVIPGMPIEKVDLRLTLDAGRLSLKPVSAQAAGGAVRADVVVDGRPKAARLTANVKASQVDLGRLIKAVQGNDVMSGGKTDVTIELAGQGNSVQTFAAGLDGKVLVVAGQGRIHNRLIDMAGADLTFQVLGKLNPFMQQDEYTTMQCAVVRYDIKDGIATTENGIAFETDKMEMLGTGTINLKNEKVNLLIQSKGKEGEVGRALKTVTRIKGVSLAGLVQVGGTLAAPRLEPNPQGIAKEGASLTAAVATGGLSVLAESLFQQATTQASACATAQQKPTPSSKSAVGPQRAKPAAAAETEDRKEGGVGGFLKGIIGK